MDNLRSKQLDGSSRPSNAERLVSDYEQVFEPLTSLFCKALVEFAGGTGPGDFVIDVAAGTGALSLPVARSGAAVLACDIDPAAVGRLSERLRIYKRAEGRLLDGEALDIPDDTFNAAFSAFGVMLFPDFRRGIRELVRVTSPGGRVALAVWAEVEGCPATRAFRIAFARAFPDRPLPPLPPGRLILRDRNALKREMELAGCAAVSIGIAEADWPVAPKEWTGPNTERLFRDHALWLSLSEGDRERLRAEFTEQVIEAGSKITHARALLAVGRKPR